MDAISYPHINELTADLLTRMQAILGEKLVGLYFYGSITWGDFDEENSDIDMLAALQSDLTDAEIDSLKKMHEDFTNQHKSWYDRIEVQYLSISGLQTFKTQKTKMAVISPGENFHMVEAGKEWLMNWYFVQEYGVTFFGPSPKNLIEPITKAEFLQTVKEHALTWREYVTGTKHSRGFQAYAILTLCRALYAIKVGEQTSKQKAAFWAEKELPEWATLIQNALVWRKDFRNKNVDNESTYPQTEKFVHFVIDKISALP
jgi:hypothetical protein